MALIFFFFFCLRYRFDRSIDHKENSYYNARRNRRIGELEAATRFQTWVRGWIAYRVQRIQRKSIDSPISYSCYLTEHPRTRSDSRRYNISDMPFFSSKFRLLLNIPNPDLWVFLRDIYFSFFFFFIRMHVQLYIYIYICIQIRRTIDIFVQD